MIKRSTIIRLVNDIERAALLLALERVFSTSMIKPRRIRAVRLNSYQTVSIWSACVYKKNLETPVESLTKWKQIRCGHQRQVLMKFKDFLDFSAISRNAYTHSTAENYIARYGCRYVCSCVTLIARGRGIASNSLTAQLMRFQYSST